MNWTEAEFRSLLGKTIVAIDAKAGADTIHLATDDGCHYRMCHHQCCCEGVSVEDIIGDIADLLNHPLTMAEEVISDEHPAGYEHGYNPDSFTWTFYKLATIKGYVTIRWYGESNGWYSESVDFEQLAEER